jgi:hypothetical protein
MKIKQKNEIVGISFCDCPAGGNGYYAANYENIFKICS